MATLEALIMVSLAEPGCTEKPWMVTVAAAALKFSYSDVAGIAAVHRVGKVCTKTGDIEQIGTLADLLVRGKADAQLAVGTALADNGLHGGHDLSHTGFIICTQQGGAVGGDQGLALHGGKEGEAETFITLPVAGSTTSPPS